MREFRTYGSMRGALGNGRPYRDQTTPGERSGIGVRRDQAAIVFSLVIGVPPAPFRSAVQPDCRRVPDFGRAG
jgi:hypothetical protein